MNFVPAKTPVIAKKLFPNYIWEIPTRQKELYLTFDDGPTPEITEWTLNTLNQFNAKATFFCIGSNLYKHPTIAQKILNNGHLIGNHTEHHVKGWKTSLETYLEEVQATQTRIDALNQKSDTKLFRPPYGQIRPEQGKRLKVLGYDIIMWDVLSFDWDTKTSQEDCLNHVISKSKEGSIIVFHDSLKASDNMMFALPKVLETFSEQGFIFKTLER